MVPEPPPDSPYGWVVVLGSFIYLMMSVGITNSFGVYMQEYQLKEFPTTPASTLSWIGSPQFASMCFFGIGAGVLLEQFDARLVGLAGSVVSGVALIVASACNTPVKLIFTQGIFFGFGGSCLLIPAMSLPSQWMHKYRALATGIAAAGGSAGGLWMSFASRAMVQHLGRAWALRITGLLIIGICGGISPLMRKRIQVPKRDKIIDFSALKNYRFVLLFFSGLFAAGGYFIPYYYMPSFSVVVLKNDQAWGANMSSILNAGSIMGRILTGMLADHIGSVNALFLSTLVSCLSILVLWLPFKHLGTLIVAAFIFGFNSGSIVSLVPVVTANLFGIKRLPSILGLLFLSYTIGCFICTPVGGALLDKYGHKTNYTSLIVYGGVFFATATLLVAVLRVSLTRNPIAKI
ncbi:MFS general substrate transporter [Martensiomyces pterosporus]|nr:MFS general substrate transporter [Martensiomyces pterosporus]